MPDIQINITDNSEETLRAFERASRAALEACGQQAVSHAKKIVTAAGRRRSGFMINSINSQLHGKNEYIGTNTEYANFHEFGTGIYIAGGRQSPWAFQDEKGNWHWTRGIPPIHFIKNSVAEHIAEYKQIFLQFLSKL